MANLNSNQKERVMKNLERRESRRFYDQTNELMRKLKEGGELAGSPTVRRAPDRDWETV